jgi:hypothetical protein
MRMPAGHAVVDEHVPDHLLKLIATNPVARTETITASVKKVIGAALLLRFRLESTATFRAMMLPLPFPATLFLTPCPSTTK